MNCSAVYLIPNCFIVGVDSTWTRAVCSTTGVLEGGTLELATLATLDSSSLAMSQGWDGEGGERKMLLRLI